MSRASASGYSGVRPAAKNKQGEHKWQAYLTVNGRKRALKGLYESPRDAAIQLAVKKQARKMFAADFSRWLHPTQESSQALNAASSS